MPDRQRPGQASKWREVLEEFREVLGTGTLLDALFPPVLFLAVNATFGFQAAMWAALVPGMGVTMLRLWRRQSPTYALAGIGSVVLAIGIVWLLGRAEGFFLPDLISNGMILALAMISLATRRPLVAWTSHLARRWPLGWYWHPKVRPAYSEVTFAWTFFFASRLIWQLSLYQAQQAELLAWVNALTGWPAMIALLVGSYWYGTWRLGKLGGPSVEEYRQQSGPPWQGQRKGF